MNEPNYEQLTLFREDSLASHSVLPGSDEARMMTVTSGLKCLELYKNSGPLGSLVRMLLESSTWRSTRCYLTWKVSATPAKRLLFRLVPQTLRTDATEFASWGTENSRAIYFIPTPRAANLPTREKAKREYKSSPGLADYVKMFPQMSWPTPTAADVYTDRLKSSQQKGDGRHSLTLGMAVKMWPTPKAQTVMGDKMNGYGGQRQDADVGGQLNPTWVEWLMGFPIGWTDLNA